MTALDRIKTAFAELARYLERYGYSKGTRRCYARFDRGFKILEIQRSRWNSADKGEFTFELSAYYPALHELDKAEPQWPMQSARIALPDRKEFDGSPRGRIGSVMPRKWDHWWEVTADSDPADLLANVVATVDQYALPWLDHNADLAWLAAYYRGFTLQSAARCYVLLGEVEQARDCLREELVKEHYSDAARAQWRRWAELVGVPAW